METEEDKLDAMSEQLDTQMKCLKIAMNIMKGKKVPPAYGVLPRQTPPVALFLNVQQLLQLFGQHQGGNILGAADGKGACPDPAVRG